MDNERMHRARSFGQVAELYDRWRPGYPDALYVDVLELGAGGRVLEAGAGTGRATLALAARGASVVAVESDAAMAAVARRRTRGMAVDVQESTFEDCAVAAGTFDLVVAAQAWHWLDPERGAPVAARALRPGGALCLWWNRPAELAGPVWNAIHDAYAEHAPALDRRAALHQQPDREQQIEPAPGFMPWSVQTYDWSATYDAESYSGLVQTHSDHLLLPSTQRERLVEAIRTAIIDAGAGRLDYHYRTLLLTAQLR
ncbi:MAG: class I SAM-dependent methyltransferase [Pseudonocardiales bacterium]|nr:class I SAM-dependent methyltransferase [Actinomycetota bacterium]PZS12251.1 MAG: class I SAM-dependent methyltransferase [Pseudonocardiales bacterium]